MDILCLFSGGKDSVYSLVEAVRLGHRVVALLNLHPADANCRELDSWMYQTAGWSLIPSIAESMGIPLLRYGTRGESACRDLDYAAQAGDEVEDLANLLLEAVAAYPTARGVACGALASGYQRSRVEAAAARAGLLSIALLWGRAPRGLLRDLAATGVESRIVRVAAGPCLPSARFIGASVAARATRAALRKAARKFGVHVAGEGGEYETLTMDSPLSRKKLAPVDAAIEREPGRSDNASWCIGALAGVEKNAAEHMRGAAALRRDWRAALCALRDGHVLPPSLSVSPLPPSPTPSSPSPAPSPLPSSSSLPPARAPFSDLFKPQAATATATATATLDSLSPGQFSLYGDQIFIAGLVGTISSSDAGTAMALALSRLKECLEAHGADLADVFFIRLWLSDMRDFALVNSAWTTMCEGRGFVTARVCVQTGDAGFVNPLVSLDAHATRGSARAAARGFLDSRRTLSIKSLSRWAPLCIGPYCQAVTLEDAFVSGSGQIGLVPETMALQEGGLWSELPRVLLNASRVLAAAGASSLTLLLGARLYVDAMILVQEAAKRGETVLETLAALHAITVPWLNGSFGRGADTDDGDYSGDSDAGDNNPDSDVASVATGASASSSFEGERNFTLGPSAHTSPPYRYRDDDDTSPLPLAAVLPVGALPRGAAIELDFLALTADAAQAFGGIRAAQATSTTPRAVSLGVPRIVMSAWAWGGGGGTHVAQFSRCRSQPHRF